MKVLVIADPILPVPPVKYGGAEREVDLTCRGLVKRGYHVHLMAGPGSKDYGGGLTIHRAPSLSFSSRAFRKSWFQFLVWRAARRVDVVINHARLDYLEILYRTKKPIIHWFHNPLTGTEISYVLSRRKQGDHFVGVSHSQMEGEKAEAARFSVIYNAVDTEAIPFFPVAATPPYVVFLGRLTPNKGVHRAIDAARRAGIKLVIGGNVPKEAGAAAYFEHEIAPHFGPACEYAGPYDEAARIKLLAGASALLFPIQWMEPFGLVMIEALASGVPVIASRLASAPEVVADGQTGFLCDTVEEMAAAIHRVSEISRHRCRASVEERFSETALLRQLEQLIARVAPAGAAPGRKKKKHLKVLMIADPILPVPPTTYGGTERGTDLMCQWLTKRGHHVHLIAGPGSKNYGGGLTIHRPPTSALYSRVYRKILFQFIAMRAALDADVIINHGRIDYPQIAYRFKKPIVHWLHNPISAYETRFLSRRHKFGDHLVALSHSQVSDYPTAAHFTVIPNAVGLEDIPFSATPVDPPYVVFLGRLTHNKGVHLAIEAARRARIKLVIGGNVPNEPGAHEYFETEIKPHLGPACEYFGQYGEAERAKLLTGATALLFPIHWKEPFGRVMIEALACGVPVIASRTASTPEVITHGKTGFLCDSTDEMVAALHRIKEISRSECRADAEERFGEAAFMRQTEELIERVAAL
jgi:glycosyltransferase involved in cell wall biosynthesis